ncbi:MAG: CBS domain-containing protein [Thermodesulfobacteriota bacterium]
MFVHAYMSRPVTTVRPETPLPEVKAILDGRKFRHLPVVTAAGILTGIITDRDVRSALPATLMTEEEREVFRRRFAEKTAGDIMTEAVYRIGAGATLDDALLVFDRTKVGALPVVDEDGRVVGVFSIRDLLASYRRLFGLGERGSALIAVEDDGKPFPVGRLCRTLEERNIPFTRVISNVTACGDGSEAKMLYVRVHTHNLSAVRAALKAAGLCCVVPSSPV